MSNTFFIGCLHLGDKQLVNPENGIRKITTETQSSLLESNWNTVVKPEDTVYILGDVTNEDPSNYDVLSKLNGEKIVVLGNHDRHQDVQALLGHVHGVCGMKYLEIDGYKIWLTHAPLHPIELTHVDFNIHAHIHHMVVPETAIVSTYWLDEPRAIVSCGKTNYINVDAARLLYTPKTLNQLIDF